MSPAHTSAAFGFQCPDCASDTRLVQVTPGVYVLQVVHDDTCPTYPRTTASSEAAQQEGKK